MSRGEPAAGAEVGGGDGGSGGGSPDVTHAPSPPMPRAPLRLLFHPPLDWRSLHAFLGRRCIPGVEHVDGDAYLRTISTPEGASVLEVRPAADGLALELRLDPPCPAARAEVRSRARRMFDLDLDRAAVGRSARPGSAAGTLGPRAPRAARSGRMGRVRGAGARRARAAGLDRGRGAARRAHRGELRGARPGGPGPRGLDAALPGAVGAGVAGPGAAHAAVRAAPRWWPWRAPSRGVRSCPCPATASRPRWSCCAGSRVSVPGRRESWRCARSASGTRSPPGISVRRALGSPGAAIDEAQALARAEPWRPWRARSAAPLGHGHGTPAVIQSSQELGAPRGGAGKGPGRRAP